MPATQAKKQTSNCQRISRDSCVQVEMGRANCAHDKEHRTRTSANSQPAQQNGRTQEQPIYPSGRALTSPSRKSSLQGFLRYLTAMYRSEGDECTEPGRWQPCLQAAATPTSTETSSIASTNHHERSRDVATYESLKLPRGVQDHHSRHPHGPRTRVRPVTRPRQRT